MKHRLVLIGPPASGKGTQAEMIVARFGIPVTSPGAILREERRSGSAFGLEAERLTSQGKLLPDATIAALVRHWLAGHDGAFLFDGFPRSLGQADALEEMLAERHTPLELVFGLQADGPILRQRSADRLVCAKCGGISGVGLHVAAADHPCPRCGGPLERRQDDHPEIFEARLQEYAEKTQPLLSYYEGRGLLRRIDASGSPADAFAAVASFIESP